MHGWFDPKLPLRDRLVLVLTSEHVILTAISLGFLFWVLS